MPEVPDFDLYAELEVSETASPETIDAAWRSLMKRNHPDTGGAADPLRAARAVRLNTAHDWLKDPTLRGNYDAVRRRQTTVPPGARPPRRPPPTPPEPASRPEPAPATAEGAPPHSQDDDSEPGPDGWRRWSGYAHATAAGLAAALRVITARGVAAAEAAVIAAGDVVRAALRVAGALAKAVLRPPRSIYGFSMFVVITVIGFGLTLRALGSVAAQNPDLFLNIPILVLAGAFLDVFVRRRRRGRRRRLRDYLAMSPTRFELAVAQLLSKRGYRLKHTGGPGDLAADLVGVDRLGRAVVVQCKRYAPGHAVRSGDIQQFVGMARLHHRAEIAIFVTTSEFTSKAVALATEHDVALIDGHALVQL